MATEVVIEPTLVSAAPSRRRLHYRGLEVTPAMLAGADAPRAGRRMFWRGVAFDGALLDAAPTAAPKRPQFYRGVFF
jgi:hypothetical protein